MTPYPNQFKHYSLLHATITAQKIVLTRNILLYMLAREKMVAVLSYLITVCIGMTLKKGN
jgi:hypothetical protein